MFRGGGGKILNDKNIGRYFINVKDYKREFEAIQKRGVQKKKIIKKSI